jgi:hypothetical protein
MKKYIITESQYKNLSEELTIASGGMDFNPIYNTISRLIADLSESVVGQNGREYLSSVAGLSDEEIDKLIGDKNNIYKLEKKSKSDLICGLIYYVFKKNYILKPFGNLSYCNNNDSDWTRNYFDEELESFIGFMSLNKIKFKGYDGIKVSGIQVVDTAKSRGYGKMMYLSLFDEFTVVKSDEFLFSESANIWVNVLPRYVNVWIIDESGRKYKKIKLKGELPIYEQYDYFIGSKENVL